MSPRFDTTIYLRPKEYAPNWYANLPRVVEARAPHGLGNTADTPVGVPKGYDAYGVRVGIGIPTGIFYDYRIGECRYYADAFLVVITSQDIIDRAGEVVGYQIGNEYPPPDNGYFDLDVPNVFQALGYDGPFEVNLENNPFYVLMFVKFGQEFDSGDWSYEWKLYQSDPLYLERRPFIYCTSEPQGADVYLKDLWVPDDVPTRVGTTPCLHTIMEKFGGKHYFEIEIKRNGYYPQSYMIGLLDSWDRWDDQNVIYADLEQIACQNPKGEEGSKNCVYDADGTRHLYRCVDGAWTLIDINHVDCGCYNQPRARFRASRTSGPVPLQVEFTYETFRFDCNPRTMIWDFGDGTGSSETNPTHLYEAPGVYTVHLEVINPNGSDSTTTTITVKHQCENPPGKIGDTMCVGSTLHECQWGRWVPIEEKSGACNYPAPTAAFDISKVNTDDRIYTYLFEDTSTPTPTSWLWDFGDGNTSMEQHPIHTYENTGEYLVTLTASNHIGSDTATSELTIGGPDEPIPKLESPTALIVAAAAITAGAIYVVSRKGGKR